MSMKVRTGRFVFTLIAALLVAAASALSASEMAPERVADDGYAAFLAMGGDPADICGAGGDGHEHDCPFCRLLSDPPSCDPVLRSGTAVLTDSWRLLEDRTTRQFHDSSGFARAPPARA